MIVKTGKVVEGDALRNIKELGRLVDAAMPMVVTQRHLGPFGKTERQLAQDRFYEALNRTAVEMGMAEPEVDEDGDTINYGIDLTTGELLAWVDDGNDVVETGVFVGPDDAERVRKAIKEPT